MAALSPARKTSDTTPAAAFYAELHVPPPARNTGNGMRKGSDPDGVSAFPRQQIVLGASCRIRRMGSLLTTALLILLTLNLPAVRGQTLEILHADTPGQNPSADLVQGSDGNYYGTTAEGGGNNYGTVFKVTSAGALTTLASFTYDTGINPRARLVEGRDGNFYGTTSSGGASNYGTVFKVTPAGALTTLVSFDSTNGSNPRAGLVEGKDGNFYGTIYSGGTQNSFGSVYRVTSAGSLTILASFNSPGGIYPTAGLVEGSDGNFYGTTTLGGKGGYGTVFKMTPSGELTTLVSFNSTNGSNPRGELVEGNDGSFYGTSSTGGADGYGSVFKITPSGELTTLVSFNSTNGSNPRAGLVEGRDGNFYGTTYSGGANSYGTVFKATPSGALTTLVSFDSSNGSNPRTGLIEGKDGNFYGTTPFGGEINYGTVFKVTPAGELSTFVSFNYNNGINPHAELVEGSDGNFYGTTVYSTPGGGAQNFGTIFKVTPAGVLTTLVSFKSVDGRNPYGGLVEGSDGSFYGTTSAGGANGYGTVFKMKPGGELATLVSFDSANGGNPYARLVEGRDGNFYGTTFAGGARNYGTVFKVTPAGVLTTLISFNATNGRAPYGRLVEGRDGNIYGTTYFGGGSGNGTVFKITPSGELTTLVSFGSADGTNPYAGLVEGRDGNFYGTTYLGGVSSSGTVFKMTPEGKLTTLVSIPSAIGRSPFAGLVEGGDGNFYGASSSGRIFKVTPAGGLAILFTFEGTVAARPVATPVFGSDGKLYGTAEQMVIWRLSVPMAPSVTTIPPKSPGKTEADIIGTVNANGSDTTVTVEYGLTPQYGSSIVATPGLVTGGKTASVRATLSGLTPHTTYFYRITASSSGGTTSTPEVSFTTANSRPVATNDSYTPAVNEFGAMTLDVLVNDSDADGDRLLITSVTQSAFGTVTINAGNLTYTPSPGFVGRDTFEYTVSDGFATATAQVELRADAPVSRVLYYRGSEIPGAGEAQSEFEEGDLFKRFGVPAINSAGSTAFTARHQTQSGADELSILVVDTHASFSKEAARVGWRAPGTQFALFSSFKDPLLNEAGDIAFLATVSGGDTTKQNRDGIWISPSSETRKEGTRLVARTGSQPPGTSAGAQWKNFTSVALASPSHSIGLDGHPEEVTWLLAFTASMTSGTGDVDATNDKGLWIASPHGTVLAMREGQLLQIGEARKRITSFAALKALANAPGQGNGVLGRGEVVAVQVFFSDGSEAILEVWLVDPVNGILLIEELVRPADMFAAFREAVARFGLPTRGGQGRATAWIGNLRAKGYPAALFLRNWDDIEPFRVLAKGGDAAPGIENANFRAFRSVALNDLGDTLVLGRVSGLGIFRGNDEGLWWKRSSSDNPSLQLLAREGAQPPGVPEGARWSSFTSLAMPEGQHGPIFTARLAVGLKGVTGQGGITSANDQGLWAVDSNGELRLIVQEGQNVCVPGSDTPRTLKSFTVMSAVPGSPSQRRSFDDKGRIVYRAVFTDGSQAIIKVQVP